MLLSEMFGEERDTEFGVKGYSVTFKIVTLLEKYEYLMYRWSAKLDWREAEGRMLYDIIAGAPDTAFDRGVIVEVGPGIKTPTGELIPLDFKVGETVLFKNFSGQQVSVKGLQFLILSENDIIAVLED